MCKVYLAESTFVKASSGLDFGWQIVLPLKKKPEEENEFCCKLVVVFSTDHSVKSPVSKDETKMVDVEVDMTSGIPSTANREANSNAVGSKTQTYLLLGVVSR